MTRRTVGHATLAIAAVVAVSCASSPAAPPLPEELRRFETEPVRELTCVACHAPGGDASEVVLPSVMTELPTGHEPVEERTR
ncbi:MAG: hypothetical protein ACRDUY_12065 [Nitriliruptorales bacterium]